MKTTKDTAVEIYIISGISEDWESQRRQLKAKFPHLTDSDLEFETAQEEKILERIQTRLNKSREEVISILGQIQDEEFLIKS
jgi:hypothetical protein